MDILIHIEYAVANPQPKHVNLTYQCGLVYVQLCGISVWEFSYKMAADVVSFCYFLKRTILLTFVTSFTINQRIGKFPQTHRIFFANKTKLYQLLLSTAEHNNKQETN